MVKKDAWDTFLSPIIEERKELATYFIKFAAKSRNADYIIKAKNSLLALEEPTRKDFFQQLEEYCIIMQVIPQTKNNILAIGLTIILKKSNQNLVRIYILKLTSLL